jgi:heme/copper-type cytochrome/quinol oxidase subunit 1
MSTLDPTLQTTVVGEPTSTNGTAGEAAVVDRAEPFTGAGVLATSDHKTIGKVLVGGSLLGLLTVATVGVILGIERVDGDGTLLDPGDLSQLFAAYRVGLVEVAALPLLLGLGVFVVPLQLGARALAFPRLAAAGVWSWLAGMILVIIALAFNGGPLGADSQMVELYLGGNVLTLVGLTAVAVSVAASVLTTRAPGMRLHRAPLFAWASLVGSMALALVLPVAAGAHILQYVDYHYGGAAFGGSSGIWPWTSFLYTGPVLGIAAIFAAGFVADLVAVTFRRRLPQRGITLVGIGLIGTAAWAGVAQQDVIALPGTGTEVRLENFATKLGFLLVWAMLTLLPALGVVIVMGIGALVAKPQRGGPSTRPNLTAAFAFGFFGLGLALVGILAAAVTGIEDLGLQATVFEEGASVATIYGAVLAGLGAAAYWFPKAVGRKLPELQLGGLATLGALGGALASVPYFIAGFLDQPGGSATWTNDGPGEVLNALVVAGHAAFGLTALAFVGLVAKAWRSGEVAGDDPWSGETLEWATTSPPPPDNFATTPTVMSPEPLLDLKARPDFAAGETGTP